jgi:hypothetical protein
MVGMAQPSRNLLRRQSETSTLNKGRNVAASILGIDGGGNPRLRIRVIDDHPARRCGGWTQMAAASSRFSIAASRPSLLLQPG